MSELNTTISSLCFGIVTFICYLIIYFSQLKQFIKFKNTSGTSLLTYIIYFVALVFWVIWSYGLYFNVILKGVDLSVPAILKQISLLPIVITNSISFLLMTAVLSIKIKHLIICKKMKISELELSSILLSKEKLNKLSWKKQSWFIKNLFLIIVSFIIFLVVVVIAISLLLFTDISDLREKDWVWVIVINWIAASFSELINWPQFIKSIKKRDLSGVPLGWIVFLLVNTILYIVYDIFIGMTSAGFSLLTIGSITLSGIIPTTGILILKIINLERAKKFGLSEKEYTKKYIIKK